jgi:hypothetical protein
MKKIFVLFTVFLFALGIVGSVGAVSISYEYSLSSDDTLTTPYDWATVETFDSTLLWSWSGSGAIVQGSVSGKYAAPYNSSIRCQMGQKHQQQKGNSEPLAEVFFLFFTTQIGKPKNFGQRMPTPAMGHSFVPPTLGLVTDLMCVNVCH